MLCFLPKSCLVYTVPQYCDGLSVSLCPLAYLWKHTPELHQIICACYLWSMARSTLLALQYVM